VSMDLTRSASTRSPNWRKATGWRSTIDLPRAAAQSGLSQYELLTRSDRGTKDRGADAAPLCGARVLPRSACSRRSGRIALFARARGRPRLHARLSTRCGCSRGCSDRLAVAAGGGSYRFVHRRGAGPANLCRRLAAERAIDRARRSS
jgi:hypothetical protein